MDLGLRGSRALITGGSRGIGLAIADVLAAEGAAVGLISRDPGGLAAAAMTMSSVLVVANSLRLRRFRVASSRRKQ